jgi:hypothetical protein
MTTGTIRPNRERVKNTKTIKRRSTRAKVKNLQKNPGNLTA